MPEDDAPPGFTAITGDDSAPPGFAPIKAAPKQSAAESKPGSSFWQRLKSAITPPPELPEGNEFSVDAGQARVPGGKIPLRQGMSEADALTNVAMLGAGSESQMGMPEGKLPTPTGALDVAKDAFAIGKGVIKGAGSVASRAAREPGKYPSIRPPTRGVLKPWAKIGVGPANIGKIMDAVIPPREPIVQPISHSPNYALIKAAAQSAAKTLVRPETISDVTKAPMEAPRLGPEINPSGESMEIPARMPKAAAVAPPSILAGTSTAPESVAGLPQEALPGIAKGAMSSTGPEANMQIGKPDAAALESGVKGSIAKPSGRLVLTPEEARSQQIMQGIAKQRASEHGMQYAAGMRPAGGGRVPMTPTATETTELPSRGSALLSNLARGNEMPPAGPSEVHEQLSNHIAAIEKAMESGGVRQYDLDQLNALLDRLGSGRKAQTEGFAGQGLGKPTEPIR